MVNKKQSPIQRINFVLGQVEDLLTSISASAIISVPSKSVLSKYLNDGERLKILEFAATEIECNRIKRTHTAQQWLYEESSSDLTKSKEKAYIT